MRPESEREDESPKAARVAAIVLAAGASRRMGSSTNKLLLEVGGEPMVRRVCRRAIDGGLDPALVVIGHEASRIRAALAELPCRFVTNADYSGPTSASLYAAIRTLDESVDAAMILLGDMVRVSTNMIVALVGAAGRGAPLGVSRYGQDVIAPPLLFRRDLWPELLACTGEGCGKRVALAHLSDAAILDWPATALLDVDTLEDYARLQQ